MKKRTEFANATALAAAICILSTAAQAQDVLVLVNGDRISGEITAIWDEEVTIEPTYSDEFKVDLEVVAYIESEREFEIELNDGREVVAQPAGGDADGNQVLMVDGQEIVVAPAQLYELEDIESRVDWDSYVDFSMSANSGNTNSLNTKLSADSTLRIGDHRQIGDLLFAREDQSSERIRQQDLLTYNYNWLFRDPWFVSGAFSYERDPIRELDRRVVTSVGMGRDIWNTPRLLLSIQLGGGYMTEEIAMSSETASIVQWVLRYRQDFFSEDMELYHNDSITHYVNGRDNTIYKTTTGIRYEITDLLYANASLDYDYETQPAPGASQEDISVLFGVGMEF